MARGKSKVNKAEFIRGLPDSVTYAEAAARGKAAGLDISKAYFYVIRSEANKSARGAEPKTSVKTEVNNVVRRSRPATPEFVDVGAQDSGGALTLSSSHPDENTLLETARKLGIGRAEALLAKLKKFELG